ncbi:hypothetical protein WA588_005396 [Blastocystis sp. NMH]
MLATRTPRSALQSLWSTLSSWIRYYTTPFAVRSEKRASPNVLENVPEEEIHRQQFARNIAFFGEEGQKRIEDAFVVVIGLGGVGSHATHMLARSGVGKLQLIDFDIVTVSSLNRHSVATRKDVGKPKVEVMRDHILEFNPDVKITVNNVMISKDNIGSLISEVPDFVIDCIDDYSTKTDILEYCIRNDIRVISSMGSGCRSNTTSLLITNITDVKYDPLAAKIRSNLKKRKIDFDASECVNPRSASDPMRPWIVNMSTGVFIPCVSSYEKPVMKIMSVEASRNAKESDAKMSGEKSEKETDDAASSESMRFRTIPVYGCVPAAFGNTICAYVLHSLSHRTFRPSAVVPLSQDVLLKLFNRLQTKERVVFKTEEIQLDRFDLLFLLQAVFKEKSVFSGIPIAAAKLEFTRWDLKKPAALGNVVLGTVEECKKHEEEGLEGMDPHERERIQGLLDRLATEEERNQCYF